MLELPALDAEERAHLQSFLPNSVLQALANRLRQRLVAALGMKVNVCELPVVPAQDLSSASEPVIEIENELAAAWLAVRFGGKPGIASLQIGNSSLIEPFKGLIRRALAEAVINHGKTVWPQAIRLQVAIDGQQGVVEIFWDSERALPWARRAIRERA